MQRILRRLAPLAGAVALVLSLAASASAENYVAMGDSYSAGNGANSTNLNAACNRNTYAYPYLLATQRASTLNFVACSGAVTSDIVNTQAAAANSTTNLVTLTIGGNDVGFSSLIVACTTLGCQSQIDSTNAQIASTLPGKLDAAYNAISSHAPNARVVVLGYGPPFTNKTCLGTTGITLAEESQLNALSTNLNNAIKTRALAHGFSYADVAPYWSGHGVCTATPYTNGLNIFSSGESYHPTRAGYASGDVPAVRAIIG